MGTIRSALDQEMRAIRDHILTLGSLVDQAINRSFAALLMQDGERAQEAINDDVRLDDLRYQIEGKITATIARQQPMARDLRLLVADLLITNELERMGDHAEGIARVVLRANGSPIDIPHELRGMKGKAHLMIRLAMEALVDADAAKARETARLDDEMDALYHQLFAQCVADMQANRLTVEQGTYLLWVGHNLERIGDRATNICERIIYACTGDVRKLNVK